MTYKEWFMTMGTRFSLSEADVDLILTNQSLDGAAQVNVRVAKTALVKEFGTIIPLANVSEGGYNVSWNMDAIKLWYRTTCAELGIKDHSKPKIKASSHLW